MANRKTKRQQNREGVAATEFAILAPILFLVIAGTMEVCSAMFLQEALTVAAYEGARTAVQRKATAAQVTARITEVLADRGVVGGSSSMDVAPEAALIFQPITVTVNAPTAGNTILPLVGWYSWIGARQFEADVVMRKEFSDVTPP